MGNTGSNSKNIKRLNRCLVLQQICTGGGVSRGEMVKYTNLTKMTVSNIMQEPGEAGLVEEVSGVQGGVALGWKPKILLLGRNSPCVVGFYIARSGLVATLSDLSARCAAAETAAARSWTWPDSSWNRASPPASAPRPSAGPGSCPPRVKSQGPPPKFVHTYRNGAPAVL